MQVISEADSKDSASPSNKETEEKKRNLFGEMLTNVFKPKTNAVIPSIQDAENNNTKADKSSAFETQIENQMEQSSSSSNDSKNEPTDSNMQTPPSRLAIVFPEEEKSGNNFIIPIV